MSTAFGPLFIAATFALNALKVEPFATYFYLFAWCGLIFSFDQLIRKREGASLVGRCGVGGFVQLLLWSAAFWYFFELVNYRLQNWYYIFVEDDEALRTFFSILSFATVFPGIFWIEHYLGLRGTAAEVRWKPWRFSPRSLYCMQAIGALFFALPLLWPSYFFPLVWGAVVLLVAPLNYRRGIDGLLRQLQRGEYGPLLRILLAGLLAGLLWESLNFWARAKWIYPVPFFEELKLFEMPLLGFGGFPPFALECTVFYRLLVYERLAPAFGCYDSQRRQPRAAWVRWVAVALAVAASLGIDRYEYLTMASTTPSLARVEALDAETQVVLQAHGVRYLTDLEGWYGRAVWRDVEGALDAVQRERLQRLAELYLHEGIGVESGNLLWRAGIESLGQLAKLTDGQVLERMRAVAEGGQRLPPAARVRVWIRRAQRAPAAL
jgi:hypothetical protein